MQQKYNKKMHIKQINVISKLNTIYKKYTNKNKNSNKNVNIQIEYNKLQIKNTTQMNKNIQIKNTKI